MAQWVIHLWVAANFFQDPPLPWVRFLSCWWHLMARFWSPYQSFSALKTGCFSGSTVPAVGIYVRTLYAVVMVVFHFFSYLSYLIDHVSIENIQECGVKEMLML
jgi:hypothetical protein